MREPQTFEVSLSADLEVLRVGRPKHHLLGVLRSVDFPHALDPARDDGQCLRQTGHLVGAQHRVLTIGGAEMDVRAGSSAVGVAGEPALADQSLTATSCLNGSGSFLRVRPVLGG